MRILRGQRLKQLRISHRLSIEKMAEKSGLSLSTIKKLEKPGDHQIREDTCRKIAEAIGIEERYLLGNIWYSRVPIDQDGINSAAKRYYMKKELIHQFKEIIDSLENEPTDKNFKRAEKALHEYYKGEEKAINAKQT